MEVVLVSNSKDIYSFKSQSNYYERQMTVILLFVNLHLPAADSQKRRRKRLFRVYLLEIRNGLRCCFLIKKKISSL